MNQIHFKKEKITLKYSRFIKICHFCAVINKTQDMQFIYPVFLFALLAVVIPILIHLYSFRRYKTVYFSNVGFLKEIKKESRKKTRPKHILILIARIFTIIFLVFAFARPYIPHPGSEHGSGRETVAVHIDNSFSMNALSEKGKLLEQARNKAVEIARSYPSGTKFKLYTNDLEPKHQNSFNSEQFIKEVSGIKESPVTVPLSIIYNRFELYNKGYENNSPKTIYLISDFQRNIIDLDNFNEGRVSCYFLPLMPSLSPNLYIDSCWVEVPAHGLKQEENIFVKIKNKSNEDYRNLPLKLYLNDSLKSITNFSVNANNEITTRLKYLNVSEGLQMGRIEITDYPFTHDNTWYISYYVEPKMKTLAIFNNKTGSQEGLIYLSSLFGEDDYVSMETMNIQSLQISKLAEFNTIFLINIENFSSGFLNELASAVSNGSSVVLFPNTNLNPLTNNVFLSKFRSALVTGIDSVSQKISGINFENRFFENVFSEKKEDAILPQIDQHLKFKKSIHTNETNLLWFQDGNKALSVAPYNNGKVWVFAFSLEKKNEEFARDILFVPSIYNIVLNSLPDQQISYTIGRDQIITLPKKMNISMESNIEIENRFTGNSFIPGLNITNYGTRMDINNMIETAGHYLVKNGSKILLSLAYNYDRNESDLTYSSSEEISEKIKNLNLKNISLLNNAERNFEEVFRQIKSEKELWKWCIIIALFCILSEVLITRLWK
jgi:hypothetical protein